ncbi:virulence-associated E family protein [Lacticaseibacillus saniviri]
MADKALLDELANKQQSAKQNVLAMTPPWKESANGGIKTTSVVNVQLAIEYDPLLQGLFRYNEFTWEVEVARDVPELHIKKGQMLDAYDSLILSELERLWGASFSDRALLHGVIALSREQSFHPVQDYLLTANKVWDREERIPKFMNTYLGVEISEITTLITRLWLVGAVAKAFEPTTKFDFVLDLVGGQGAGKTTLLEKLANGWYTDQFINFSDKDGYGTMLRSWIVNDDELTATSNSSFEELKKFISARRLEFRPAYGKTTVRRDKSFVIARTTNEETYLKDKTGERRFLPLKVNKQQQKKHPVTDLTPEVVQQLWGEAVALYQSGFSFEVTTEQEKQLNLHRSMFMYVDAIEDEIENVLGTWQGDFITSKEIGNNIGAGDLVKNKSAAKKIKYIMDNRDDWETGTAKVSGVARRGWRKKL